MSYRTFLELLCAEEIAHRAQTRITRSVRKARFPFLRTIEEDGDLAEAILDRPLERGTRYVLRGRSYRTRHPKEDASATAEDAA
jgi:DNA replication protein DnaC